MTTAAPLPEDPDERRAAFVDAGVRLLLERGPGLGLDHLSYQAAFDVLADRGIRVTRASVHERIWPSVEAWRLDVLATTVAADNGPDRASIERTIREILDALPDEPARRRFACSETIRLLGHAREGACRASVGFSVFVAVGAAWIATPGSHREHDELRHELEQTYAGSIDNGVERYRRLIEHFGATPRADLGLTLDHVAEVTALAASALAESAVMRNHRDPGAATITTVEGESRTWNRIGLGVWSVLDGLLEFGVTR